MKLLRFVSKVFFPEKCIRCGKLLSLGEGYCLECESKEYLLPDSFCLNCNNRNCICENDEPLLRHICAVYFYSGTIRNCIIRFKFRKQKQYADFFSEKMLDKIVKNYNSLDFDCVTFVPMTPDAKRKRGYNQSELLAARVAKGCFVPKEEFLVKTSTNLRQHTLSAESRKHNVQNVFALKDGADVKGKTVLICDDIKTTGSTLAECQRILLENGAKDVYCAVIAVPYYDRLDKAPKSN